VFAAAVAARYYSRSGPGLLRVKRRRGLIPGATRAIEARQPKGVIGLTTAWNFPIVFAAVDGFPALVAGNAIVHRPDHKGAMAVLWLRSLAIEAGVPEGLWQVVLGPGHIVGNAVTDHADYVAFTGSTGVGREVAQRAGRRLIGCSLELGGKNPLLVLADAHVEKAAAGAVRATFTNTGQACVGTERILVADEIHDQFVAAFLARVRRLRVGTGLSFDYDMGSLIDQAQLDQVGGHIADAVAKGATVLHEGRPRPDLGPFVHEPTVLAGVRHGMRVRDEETFGPVVSIERFHTQDEAVAYANDTPYGLAASIWSGDVRGARRLAQRLHAGGVDINEYYGATWGSIDLSQGGMKDSGLGRRNGRDGLLRFTEAQAIASQHIHGIHPPANLANGEFARLLTTTLKTIHWTRRA
jgi:succinate-semialdehyde dehydrogenase / glutarate-semialdehyde dehydrogenase